MISKHSEKFYLESFKNLASIELVSYIADNYDAATITNWLNDEHFTFSTFIDNTCPRELVAFANTDFRKRHLIRSEETVELTIKAAIIMAYQATLSDKSEFSNALDKLVRKVKGKEV